MTADLHNHTTLCNHATGTMREYVQKAIENKTKYFGFADHAPMEFDKQYRMSFSQMPQYENSVKELKNEYKNQIDILLGYEVDFLPNFMDERVLNSKCDYLIGSVHFLNGWGFDNPEFIGAYEGKDIDKIWEEYFEAIENLAKSGNFDIIGHLDLMKVFKFLPKKDVRILAKNALRQIKKNSMVVELNSAGFRKPIGEQYPSHSLLESIAELDIDITFSSDAHSVEQVGLNGEKLITIMHNFGYEKCAIFKNREKEMIKF